MTDRSFPVDPPTAQQRAMSLLLAVSFIAVSIAIKLLSWWALSLIGALSPASRSIAAGALALGLAAALTWIVSRWWPDLAHPGLTVHPRLSQLKLGGVGLIAGLVLFAAVYGVARLTGAMSTISGLGHPPATLLAMVGASLLATVLNAWWEEYTFRGWPFAACVRAYGAHGVALGIGAAFGLAHLFNPNWIWQAIVSTALAGVLLGYCMLAARRIIFPIGLHVGWNFTQALLTSRRYWRWVPHRSVLRSGGIYGLEASLGGIAITAVAAAVAAIRFVRGPALDSGDGSAVASGGQ